jgi:virginiamycin B lyase
MRGTGDDDVNTRARSTPLSKRRVLALALCLGLTAGFMLSSTASAATVTEYTGLTGYSPSSITSGSDGNLWFTEYGGNKIGRITTGGAITEYTIPTGSSGPWGITSGPDNNIWFTEMGGNKIGCVTTGGSFTEYTIPTGSSGPSGITSGPDNNIWFTEMGGNKIGCVTTGGSFTEYTIPTGSSSPSGITSGPDGKLWFTESATSANKIGCVTTGGSFTAEYTIPTGSGYPWGITSGPDGNLWFTEYMGNKMGRITTGGTVTEYTGLTASSYPFGITSGPDGNLWFTEYGANRIGSLKDETQRITGNPDVALAIAAPSDNTGMAFAIGSDNADEDSDADNLVNCKSNITYTVKINCDVTGNKTSDYMWEWNGSSYVASGKKLQTRMSMRTHGDPNVYAAITGTATAIDGFTSMSPTPDSGTDTYVDYKQPVNYGDQRLSSNTYRHLLTYTIVSSV